MQHCHSLNHANGGNSTYVTKKTVLFRYLQCSFIPLHATIYRVTWLLHYATVSLSKRLKMVFSLPPPQLKYSFMLFWVLLFTSQLCKLGANIFAFKQDSYRNNALTVKMKILGPLWKWQRNFCFRERGISLILMAHFRVAIVLISKVGSWPSFEINKCVLNQWTRKRMPISILQKSYCISKK